MRAHSQINAVGALRQVPEPLVCISQGHYVFPTWSAAWNQITIP
jgi:hypothetical protein